MSHGHNYNDVYNVYTYDEALAYFAIAQKRKAKEDEQRIKNIAIAVRVANHGDKNSWRNYMKDFEKRKPQKPSDSELEGFNNVLKGKHGR